MSTTYAFFLPGVTCAACVTPVENALRACRRLPVLEVDVGILTQQAEITVGKTALPPAEVRHILKTEMEDIGYECRPIMISAQQVAKAKQHLIRWHWLKGWVGVIAGGAVMALSVLGWVLPFWGMLAVGAASTGLALYLGKESYRDAARKLRKQKTLTMDSLFSLSSFMALTVSILSLFIPALPMMFDAALLIFGFRHIGKRLKSLLNNALSRT